MKFLVLFGFYVFLLQQDYGTCTEPSCPAWTLCSEYMSSTTDSACEGRLVSNGFVRKTVSSGDFLNPGPTQCLYFITTTSLLVSLFGHGVTFRGHIIRGVCEGTEVTDPTQFPLESCSSGLSTGGNVIKFECAEQISTEGSGIVVTNCSADVDVYLVDYTSCSCEVEGNSSVSWDECAGVDVSRVLPSQSEECLRRQCLRFFTEACSCCSIHCVSDPSYSVNASSLCPSSLLNECGQKNGNFSCEMNCTMGSLSCDVMPGQSVCQKICDDPFQDTTQTIEPSSHLTKTDVMGFCADHIQCSNLTLLDRNCSSERSKCASICLPGDEVVGFLSEGCPVEVFQFCDEKFLRTLFVDGIVSDVFTTSVNVLQEFLGSVSPSFIVPTLSDLFEVMVIDQLDILSQAEVILSLFDDLFDDQVSYEGSYDVLSDVLLLLEIVLKLISAVVLDQNATMPFTFEGNNLFVSVGAPNRTQSVDNRHTVELKGNKNLDDFNTNVSISTSILCEANEGERCSSVVALAAVNNLADNLHQAARNTTSEEQFEFSGFVPATDLLSMQVFGVEDLRERLLDSPVEFVITLPMHNVTERDSIECVFWNHTLNLWSNESVITKRVDNNTVRCTSKHLTSFAVLVSLNRNATDSLAQSIVSYIGCIFSIICLLATIICLIVFRKILNKGSLLYVHLNLSVALLLGYLFFVVGIETAVNIPGLCITLAALMQYFFLASFCWMLCEGIMLYLLVVRVFGTAAQRWYWLLIPGWGVPLPIVVISAAVLQENYISPSYCWLDFNPMKAAIWTFIVPMLLIILVNTVILVLTVVSIVRGRKKGGAESKVNTRTLVITALKGAVILLPLLGITWVIGLFAVNENTEVFAWIFLILNSFQGVFIFVLHVLRNPALLKKMKQACCRRTKKSPTTTASTVSKLDSSTRPVSPSFASVSYSGQEKKHDLSPNIYVEAGSDVLMQSNSVSDKQNGF